MQHDISAIVIVTILLDIGIVLFPSNPLRIVLGLPFLLFFPGYLLTAAVFPQRTSMGGIERIPLSIGASIAVVILTGLILNYTPWGIRLHPLLVAMSLFVITLCLVVWRRRRGETAQGQLRSPFRQILSSFETRSRLGKVSAVILLLAILSILLALGYVFAQPRADEHYTESYLLGMGGEPTLYPKQLVFRDGQVVAVRYEREERLLVDIIEPYGRVTVGITNHEDHDVTYALRATVDDQPTQVWSGGTQVDSLGPILLRNGESWEQIIGFALTQSGVTTAVNAPAAEGAIAINVDAMSSLEPGDRIMVGSGDKGESVEIAAVGPGNCIALKTSLRYDHPVGDIVWQQHRVSFVLYKDGMPYFEPGQETCLWVVGVPQ